MRERKTTKRGSPKQEAGHQRIANRKENPTMPYMHLDLAKTYPSQTKRDLAARVCRLYADVMQTQLWRPNVGIAELGEDNLFHLGADGPEPITMVLVETRRGRSLDRRLELG